jgi:hypothetical protein
LTRPRFPGSILPAMNQRRKPSDSRGPGEEASLRFTPFTGALGSAGLLVIAAGLYFLNQGSINLAPVLLVLGYGVLIPLALIK